MFAAKSNTDGGVLCAQHDGCMLLLLSTVFACYDLAVECRSVPVLPVFTALHEGWQSMTAPVTERHRYGASIRIHAPFQCRGPCGIASLAYRMRWGEVPVQRTVVMAAQMAVGW